MHIHRRIRPMVRSSPKVNSKSANSPPLMISKKIRTNTLNRSWWDRKQMTTMMIAHIRYWMKTLLHTAPRRQQSLPFLQKRRQVLHHLLMRRGLPTEKAERRWSRLRLLQYPTNQQNGIFSNHCDENQFQGTTHHNRHPQRQLKVTVTLRWRLRRLLLAQYWHCLRNRLHPTLTPNQALLLSSVVHRIDFPKFTPLPNPPLESSPSKMHTNRNKTIPPNAAPSQRHSPNGSS